MKFKNQKGQAVLIVLLSLSVVLVVSLFVVSRSITDISLSTKEGDSLRAFSAAEAGIERALVVGDSAGNLGNASFGADVSDFAKGANKIVYPLALRSGEYATFWFSRGTSDNQFAGNIVDICWGAWGTVRNLATTPALEFTLYYNPDTADLNNLTKIKIARVMLDPNNTRVNDNHFSILNSTNDIHTCEINGEQFEFHKSFYIGGQLVTNYGTPGVLKYVTVRMLYNTDTNHKVGLDLSGNTGANSILPSQGNLIESVGSSSDSNRKIEVYELFPVIPPIFNNALFSTSDIQ